MWAPSAREAVRAQQLQQMTGVSRVRLLLAHHRRANRCGIAHPEFVPAAIQQTLEPSRRAGGLHSYAGPARQRGVEIGGFLPVVGQPPLHDFCGFRVEHGNLLIPRMKITAYHPHRSAPFFRTLVVKRNQVYSVARSRRLHGIRQDDKQAHGRKGELAQRVRSGRRRRRRCGPGSASWKENANPDSRPESVEPRSRAAL